MTAPGALACRIDRRRRRLFGNHAWNGLDYLDVADDQRSLCVHFFGGIPEGLGPENVRVVGGRRIADIQVVDVRLDPSRDEEVDDCLRVALDRPGDFSTYSLCLVDVPGIDPRFACLDFNFKTNCASDLDCGESEACPPPVHAEPDINYLAKDYASFLQLIYDRLALILPDWRERHAADLQVTLVEILAYVGDYLSYYQDAVATEAYLGTARQRISVKRHLRLIDHMMHEGCNARAFVTIGTDADFTIEKADDFYFVTDCPGMVAGDRGFVQADSLAQIPSHTYAVFEPLGSGGPFAFHAAHTRIAFYDWGDGECCLPRGATRATLLDHADEPDCNAKARLQLRPGDYLIFEEERGPLTGSAADADPAHRHVIRLTDVTRVYDALLETLAFEIEWAPEDALPFPLCITSRRPPPECDGVRDVSIARGNVVPVDHGRQVRQTLDVVSGRLVPVECACEGSIIEARRESSRYEPALEARPLTFAEPLRADAPAAAMLARDPRAAAPAIALADPDGRWTPRPDLLASGADDRHFVVEIDDEGFARLRFGEGSHGRRPDIGVAPAATYRSGNGSSGNVGREAISRLVLRSRKIDGPTINVRNPQPASGGADPEPMEEARLSAPGLIHARRERAIVAEDYAELAARDARLQGATAGLRWTGSWHEARVAIDAGGSSDPAPALLDGIAAGLHIYRRIGHDLAVAPARIVPLRLALHVCVLPHFSRAHVKAALLDIFNARSRAKSGLGFFHPDNMRFGQSVALSRIVAAAMAVDGIETVHVAALHRISEPDDGAALKSGQLALRPNEIARLDNDPNYPENGKIELDLGGGR
ncbi:MAG TPA: putative baseplate assembly protein [Allosphingosinicella sp.]|jgi:hypothetical protein|nr:putative baseplate assembly protein [Allosphingosinicella sp.]